MTRVLCCYVTAVQADCAAALAAFAPGAEYACVAGDDRAYGREIAARWGGTQDLVIIEPDNEITAEVLPSFDACPEPWCTYAYECFPPPETRLFAACLGCTRFSARFQREFSFAERVLAEPCTCGEIHDTWRDLDWVTAHRAQLAGFAPHVHGEIRHFHPYLPFGPTGVFELAPGSGFRLRPPAGR